MTIKSETQVFSSSLLFFPFRFVHSKTKRAELVHYRVTTHTRTLHCLQFLLHSALGTRLTWQVWANFSIASHCVLKCVHMLWPEESPSLNFLTSVPVLIRKTLWADLQLILCCPSMKIRKTTKLLLLRLPQDGKARQCILLCLHPALLTCSLALSLSSSSGKTALEIACNWVNF